jgi:hypothetical protein
LETQNGGPPSASFGGTPIANLSNDLMECLAPVCVNKLNIPGAMFRPIFSKG